jgi:Domain of unknown function (DUF4166)
MTEPLYRRVLRAGFDALPPRVRELHDLHGVTVWEGMADVECGGSFVCRFSAWVAGLPPAGRDQALHVTFQTAGTREIWTRQFGQALFRSTQYQRGSFLLERVGPTTFVFTALASEKGLALQLDGFRVLGVPVPRLLHPCVNTFECERDGRYRFEVEARLPLFGLLVRYSGWLLPRA